MHIKSFWLKSLRKLGLSYEHESPTSFEEDGHTAAAINIVIGPNGGGKSTVVDLIRSMGDASVLTTLARENLKSNMDSGFRVVFDSGREVRALFNSMDIEKHGLTMVTFGAPDEPQAAFSNEISDDIDPSILVQLELFIKFVDVVVHYRRHHDETDVDADAFIAALNTHASHLLGLDDLSRPSKADPYRLARSQPVIQRRNEEKLSLILDDAPDSFNHLRIETIPSGWRALGGLLAWLSTREDHSICVIEEPETHLHPTLQRLLVKEILAIVVTKHLQLFVTTHSPTLIDFRDANLATIKLFEADGRQLRELTEPTRVLHSLGVKPSDICLANGVVWVEGASDRLYILHWMRLWCEKHARAVPREHADFVFAFYGGAMLKHHAVGPGEDVINILMINPHAFIVMDRDQDFVDIAGHACPKTFNLLKGEFATR